MTLNDLLGGLTSDPAAVLPPVPVSGLALDSRHVQAGDLFFARDGSAVHGLDFADAAVAAGAVGIVTRSQAMLARPHVVESLGNGAVPVISVGDVDCALGVAADRFFGEPSKSVRVGAVTGTNGKSTVAWLCATVCEALDGSPAGLLGTLGKGLLGELSHGHIGSLTTANAVEVARTLASVRDAGATHALMEASSHALDQRRLAGTRIAAAAFSNLSRDHLDYHGSEAAYLAAKQRLFFDCAPGSAAFNIDDAAGDALATAFVPRGRTIACTLRGREAPRGAELLAADIMAATADGLELSIAFDGASLSLRSPLIGTFNAENLLLSLGLLVALGYAPKAAAEALAGAEPPPGRMQRSGGGGLPVVIVDYAHTPDALARALDALRPLTTGKLWCVFGCGGDRDRGKRPLMAEAAATRADRVIFTDDNPRNEDGDVIVADAMAGVPAAVHGSTETQRDRASAIRSAVSRAAQGDVVLVAGKGHEDYQEVAGERLPFLDIEVVRDALAHRGLRLASVGGRTL